MNATQTEFLEADIMQAIQAQATSLGLSVSDYLRNKLGVPKPVQSQVPLEPEAPLTPMAEASEKLREAAPPRNEAMLAALQRSTERWKDIPPTGSMEKTLRIIREGRAGAMYGYEPMDFE